MPEPIQMPIKDVNTNKEPVVKPCVEPSLDLINAPAPRNEMPDTVDDIKTSGPAGAIIIARIEAEQEPMFFV